jgi:hypothetical protein
MNAQTYFAEITSNFWYWLFHDAGGFFTSVLVIIGVIQIGVFLRQLRLIRQSLAPAKEAAEAAKDSAEAAHRAIDEAEKRDKILQRAYLWPGFGKHEPAPNGMKWFITVHNTGQTAGIIQTINYAVQAEDVFKAGWRKFKRFKDREDVIPPSPPETRGKETGLVFVIDRPKVCWGWIEYEDVFGVTRTQGWKHRLNLAPDSAGNHSNPYPGCYSSTYRPWEDAEIDDEGDQQ